MRIEITINEAVNGWRFDISEDPYKSKRENVTTLDEALKYAIIYLQDKRREFKVPTQTMDVI